MIERIIKLDTLTANKIAAGEVVDRPASVVKELVENAIDAMATNIIIEIKDGGKTYIRVTDNGNGIHESDVEVAFERHATSKLKTIEDLYTITSLGFRGEALASIASVSQIELISKTEEAITGTYLELHGGRVVCRKKIGCPKGTTIVVQNLFYNTPARYEFMKSNTAETSYISDIVSKLALAHSNISFRFINNGTIVFTTSGSGDILNNIANIYGKEIAQNMEYLSIQDESLSIEGYISKPSVSRGNRKLQAFFVNGRYVKSKVINEAVEEAYKTLMLINRFPICFMYINMFPHDLDINIHPAKTEIRFKDEKHLKKVLVDAIREKLFQEDLIPKEILNKHKKSQNMSNPTEELTKPIVIDHLPEFIYKKDHIIGEDKFPYFTNNKIENNSKDDVVRNKSIYLEKKENKLNKQINQQIILSNIQVIGQLFNTYLIGQDENNMYLIDQHAAHERILYEWLIGKYKKGSIVSQKLLTPIIVELSYGEFEMIKDNIDIFYKLGFEIEEFGISTFALRSVPMIFGEPEAKDFFMEIVDNVSKNLNFDNSYDMKMEKIISQACKNAIKAKNKLEPMEIDALLNQLSKLQNPYTCPHGRPIIISITKYEIERKFKRII